MRKTIIDDDDGISIQAETEENEGEQVARKCRYSKHRQGKKKTNKGHRHRGENIRK